MTARLTSQQRRDREMTEEAFMLQVTGMAEILGWSWAHFRPARTAHGWRTPVSGPIGAGFPDLVLVRARDRRIVFAELKRETGKPDPAQAHALDLLGECAEAYVWRPSDFDRIAEVLR
jgi:hypothetical protein